LTTDNGSEFLDAESLERSCMKAWRQEGSLLLRPPVQRIRAGKQRERQQADTARRSQGDGHRKAQGKRHKAKRRAGEQLPEKDVLLQVGEGQEKRGFVQWINMAAIKLAIFNDKYAEEKTLAKNYFL
jgi:hypothetical protein